MIRTSDFGPRSLGGPRVGITFVTGESAETLDDKFDASPVVTQFGWHFEQRFFSVKNGLCGVTEVITLIGGVEQGLFLPSLSWLAGIRTPSGFEVGFGPNISLTGFAYVIGTGVTIRQGQLNIPLNFSVVMSKKGARISFLVGFNAAG
ncbi:hypothetical protein ACFL6A_02855 [bacterium]